MVEKIQIQPMKVCTWITTTGSSWVRIDTVVAYNDTNFNTLNSVAIAIPLAARAAGTRYRLIQPAQSGGYFDNYGITSISYSYSYTYNPLVIIDHGSVLDQEAYTLEDWGRIIYEDTNFPFGELRPVSNTTWTVVHAWVGSGTVFERGDTYYRLVAPYIVSGTLEVSGSAITHWVPSISNGLFGIQSLTNVAFSKKESGSGNLFNIGNGFSLRSRAYLGEGTLKLESNTAVAFQPNWVGEGTIAIDGAVQDVKRTFGFQGSGTLPALNGQVERRTYSYNTSAVVPFNYLDFGTIPLQTYQHITSNQTLSGVSTEPVVLVDPGVTATVDPQYQVAQPLGTPQNTIEYSPITIGKTTNEIGDSSILLERNIHSVLRDSSLRLSSTLFPIYALKVISTSLVMLEQERIQSGSNSFRLRLVVQQSLTSVSYILVLVTCSVLVVERQSDLALMLDLVHSSTLYPVKKNRS